MHQLPIGNTDPAIPDGRRLSPAAFKATSTRRRAPALMLLFDHLTAGYNYIQRILREGDAWTAIARKSLPN
jgi:hypothetical protein